MTRLNFYRRCLRKLSPGSTIVLSSLTPLKMVKVLTLSGKTVKVYDDELEVGHVELPSSADCEAAKLEHDASQNDHPMPDLRPR